jgi:hypothetical protein
MSKADMEVEDVESVLLEMTILKGLDHPNIMKVYYTFD